MKLILAMVLSLVATSAYSYSLSRGEGTAVLGTEVSSQKECMVAISKVGTFPNGAIKLTVEAYSKPYRYSSILGPGPQSFRGLEKGPKGTGISSSLYTDGQGVPNRFVVSALDENAEEEILFDCRTSTFE